MNTPQAVNQRIRRETDERIRLLRDCAPDVIQRRLQELNREWDIERCLETGASSLSLLGLMLSQVSSRRWLLLPAGVAGFLLQHAVQGWCPPLPLLRRLGVRTADEINRERYSLLALLEEREALAKVESVTAEAAAEAGAVQAGVPGLDSP